MPLRGVLQFLPSAAGRLLGRSRNAMTQSLGETAATAARPTPAGDPIRNRSRLPFLLGLIIVVLALCSGLATYLILTGLTPIVPTHRVVVGCERECCGLQRRPTGSPQLDVWINAGAAHAYAGRTITCPQPGLDRSGA